MPIFSTWIGWSRLLASLVGVDEECPPALLGNMFSVGMVPIRMAKSVRTVLVRVSDDGSTSSGTTWLD
jgi:hypothetical protein